MKSTPILFSAPMIRALLAGTKIQTRRVVKAMAGQQRQWLTPELINASPSAHFTITSSEGAPRDPGVQLEHPRGGPLGWIRSPFGGPGDQLWVRETWNVYQRDEDGEFYGPYARIPKAKPAHATIGYAIEGGTEYPWRPSIHMPRWASRITLELRDVRVERLQEISDDDCVAEGVDIGCPPHPADQPTPRMLYQQLWEDLNGEGSWAKNPFVWVLAFRKL